MAKDEREAIGLPVRPFLYTVDQIATLLQLEQSDIESRYLFFDRRSTGARPKDKMLARNIAPDGEPPDWRITERELIRWMRFKGWRFYERAYPTK